MSNSSLAARATRDKRRRLARAARVAEASLALAQPEKLREERRQQISARVEATHKRVEGMSDAERHRYKRDLLYRVARRRGASEHQARRVAIDFTARPTGSAAQGSRERRPGSTRSSGSRRGSTSSRSSGSRGDPDPGEPEPPGKKRRPCLNCAAFTESTVDWHGHTADLCPTCVGRLADGQRPVLAALGRAFGGGAA